MDNYNGITKEQIEGMIQCAQNKIVHTGYRLERYQQENERCSHKELIEEAQGEIAYERKYLKTWTQILKTL